ncbi:MAG: nuclear transport factor 2 family protein [Burkholderiales bacterium]|nr:nuclear transport factor 2 family protein [Burkholderiales bacterium]
MTAFTDLLDAFVAHAQANDGARFAALFTPDGVYDDYFFGAHTGRNAIAAMLARFHEGGEDYRWEFHEPLSDGRVGYARYRFSYRSRVPESAGAPIAFEGMCRMRLEDGLIADYAEVFDRGVAFVQLRFPAGKVARLLEKYAAAQNAAPGFAPHLARFGPQR